MDGRIYCEYNKVRATKIKPKQTEKPNLAAEFLQQAISKQKYALTIILVLKRNHKY